MAGRIEIALLRRINHPPPAIEPALTHPRQIDVAEIGIEVVCFGDAPPGPVEMHRRVEVGIERQDTLVQRGGGVGGRRGLRRRRGGTGGEGEG